MIRLAIVFVLVALGAAANPISGYLVFPPHTMVAENVLVGVTEKGAVVSGRYRFRITPDAPEHWGPPPYTLAVQLPVPIPSSLKKYEDIEAIAHPFLTIGGVKYEPLREVFYYDVPALPREAKLAVFSFRVDREDFQKDIEILLQYDQPIIRADGKEMVYYVPFLPTFEQYRKAMDLRQESYLVTFESFGSTVIRLASPVTQLERSGPHMIAVCPRHREVIAVERRPNQTPEPTAMAVTPPAAQEPRQP